MSLGYDFWRMVILIGTLSLLLTVKLFFASHVRPLGCGEYLCPSFLLIGERKCGTTSFFQFLIGHPEIIPPMRKEIAFFTNKKMLNKDELSNDDLLKYVQNFPSKHTSQITEACMEQVTLAPNGKVIPIEPFCKSRKQNVRYITGEASATYLSQANPRLILHTFPDVKLLVSLRCPIKRAISHHAMHLRFRKDGRKRFNSILPLNEALLKDLQHISDKESQTRSHYIEPGIYVGHLNRWLSAGWALSNFGFVFQEEMDQASSSTASLFQFLTPTFQLIGVNTNISLGALQIDSEAKKLNTAPGYNNELPQHLLQLLCDKVFLKANRDLAFLLGRPLPHQWECLSDETDAT